MASHNLSIKHLLLSTLALAFALVLIFTISYGVHNERQRAEHFAHRQAESLGKSYFDALNTMMLTGAMGNRQVLQGKLQSDADVISVRAIRAKPVTDVFGAGLSDEQPRDELDRRALNGETIHLIRDNVNGQKGRVMTVIKPVLAEKDYQGTNCLMCHQVPEHSVLGAMRVDYSLARMDSNLVNTMITSAGVQLALFLLAFFATAWVLNGVVIKRLRRFNESMSDITKNSDFTIELEVLRNDEIGLVSRDFNRMIDQINGSMHRVVGNADRLLNAAEQISSIADTTGQEVLQQKQNTDQVVAAMTEMAASAEEVRGNATRTAEHSQDTKQSAELGSQKAEAAAADIQTLNDSVQRGAERIRQLNGRTDEVAAVLAVISSIAEQTNLLALNAAIEAARAGEQGRGFAVVADEVRSLASRTQESTDDIRQTIERLSSDAADCVSIMEQASNLAEAQVESIHSVAEDLQGIAAAVNQISDLNIQMDVAANEQSQVAESINQNVMGISQSAETTANDAQTTARIAKDMLAIANELEDTVNQFKLKQQ